MTLNDIALARNTDKSSNTHNYCPIYQTLFEPIKNDVKVMLEIGIEMTASIMMWRDYFPNAFIYGIDLVPCNDGGERTKNYIVDQSKPEELKWLMEQIGEPLDIIIDDGSHDLSHIIISLTFLYPHLKSGGLYLIEDLEIPRVLDEQLKGYEHWYAVADSPIWNSNIIVIRKP